MGGARVTPAAFALIVESRQAPTKEGPWSEPRPVMLAGPSVLLDWRGDVGWCDPYVVSNAWEQSRTVAYLRGEA